MEDAVCVHILEQLFILEDSAYSGHWTMYFTDGMKYFINFSSNLNRNYSTEIPFYLEKFVRAEGCVIKTKSQQMDLDNPNVCIQPAVVTR